MDKTREGFAEGVTLAILKSEREKVEVRLKELVNNPLFLGVLYDLGVITGSESETEVVDRFMAHYDQHEAELQDAYAHFSISETTANLWEGSYLG